MLYFYLFLGAEASQGQAEKQDADMRYYNHLMDQVPSESYSPALILDVLLRQVEATVDHNDPMDLPIPARQDLLERSLGSHLDFKLENLGLKNPDTQVCIVTSLDAFKMSYGLKFIGTFLLRSNYYDYPIATVKGNYIPSKNKFKTQKHNKLRWLASNINFKLLHTGCPIAHDLNTEFK